MEKQVDQSHYNFSSYMDKRRWISVWHQLDEVIRLQPETVLEVGPGGGVFKSSAAAFGLKVQTLDLDSDLQPDYLGTADSIPLPNGSFDVVCAFQVLEHMPFDISMIALREMCRVARKAVVISLPDFTTSWASTLTLPKLGTRKFVLRRPGYRPPKHKFDGEHYWEIGKHGYMLDEVVAALKGVCLVGSMRTYRVHENQYHRFFIFEK